MLKLENFRHLDRQGLQEKLSVIENMPLLVMTAPMGYGKSTAVHEFFERRTAEYLWVSLGTDSIGDEALWSRFIMELKNAKSELYQQMTQLGFPTVADWDKIQENSFLTLLKDSFFDRNYYLVIDDYQAYNGSVIAQLLTRVVLEDIAGLHIILVGRSCPAIPVEELMLKGYCFMIDQNDMTLSPEETKELFLINGIDLDTDQTKMVYEYTDGWIAAVSLLELDYQHTGILQFSEAVNRLTRSSVFQELTDEEKYLLHLLYLFPGLSLEELNVISLRRYIYEDMDRLIQKTGLVHLSQKNKYSIHSLLRNVVEGQSADDPQKYYFRYAQFHEMRGNLPIAIEYYNKADDIENILCILDGDERFSLFEQIPDLLYRFFRKNQNSPLLLKHPTALLSFIYEVTLSSDINLSQRCQRFFFRIRKSYEVFADNSQEYADICGEMMIIESQFHFNDVKRMNQTLMEALKLRCQKSSSIFSRKVYSYGIPNTLSMYHTVPGTLKQTVEDEKEYSRNYMRLVYHIQGSLDTLVDAEYALETGNITTAMRLAEESLEKAVYHRQPCIVISSYLVLLRCYVYFGDKHAFDTAIQKSIAYMADISEKIQKMDYDQVVGYVYAILNQLEKIPLWLRERNIDNCNQIVRDTRSGCIIHGIFLARKGRWALLSANAEEMMLPYTDTQHAFAQIFARIFQSIVSWKSGSPEQAKSFLWEALTLARPDGIVMPFAELSGLLMPIMNELFKENQVSDDDYFQKLSQTCSFWLSGAKMFQERIHDNAVFTNRETQIMDLLVAGCRNNEIARQMNIAPVTVEKNLTNIYRKIGVTNRTSAIKWYLNVFSQPQ